MGSRAAREGDRIVGTDELTVMVPAGTTEVPARMECHFEGKITSSGSANVFIGGKQAATVESTAPVQHRPPPGTRFDAPPNNRGTIQSGSTSVMIDGKPAARVQDDAAAGNAPVKRREGTVTATGTGTVWIGG